MMYFKYKYKYSKDEEIVHLAIICLFQEWDEKFSNLQTGL